MKKMLYSSILGLAFVASNAHAQFVIRGEDRFNIDIPATQIDPIMIQDAINKASAFIVEGKREVPIQEALASIAIPPQYQALVDKIAASRNPTADVECLGRKCKITSLGQELSFKVDGLNIPILGVPVVYLNKVVEFYTQVSLDESRAEVCRITGVAIKAGFTKPTLDGALLEMNKGVVKTARMDAGTGGDYPSLSCDFVSPTVPTRPGTSTN
ncbi:MAG: hypothetical protein H7249_05195 [Chitinophagaceae bacterium]|nr:hypothetical protein [Oligoflexus sp.]